MRTEIEERLLKADCWDSMKNSLDKMKFDLSIPCSMQQMASTFFGYYE